MEVKMKKFYVSLDVTKAVTIEVEAPCKETAEQAVIEAGGEYESVQVQKDLEDGCLVCEIEVPDAANEPGDVLHIEIASVFEG
jgi:hypothetical protein